MDYEGLEKWIEDYVARLERRMAEESARVSNAEVRHYMLQSELSWFKNSPLYMAYAKHKGLPHDSTEFNRLLGLSE